MVRGNAARIVRKLLPSRVIDYLGIIVWTPEDERFQQEAEMNYYNLTGINPYETNDCPKHFKQEATDFKKRLKSQNNGGE